MKLNIVVLAKQVPDTRNVGKDAMTAEGTVNRAALPAIFNPEDLNALEQALRLKDQNPGSTVGILTMGPPRAGEIIRQGLYRGTDTGWLLTDRLFAGADTLATSYALATGIQKIGHVDIVIGGRQAIDGDTAQVGPQISEHLDIPVISYAEDIKIDGDSVVVQRQYEDRYHILKAKMPCLVTALAELNEPRYMTPGGIFDAYDAEVTVWGRKDLKDVEDSNLGLAGSPTKIAKASDKVRKGAGEKVTLDPEEAVDYIMDKLAEKHVI
jgi:electron transfer flavoprotein beta subunit